MSLERQLARARGRSRALFLDYDGTLVPFADAPHLASPDADLLDLLDLLGSRSDTAVHIVSGRSRTSLDAWLGHLPIGLYAEHGFWQRPDPRRGWIARLAPEHGRWTASVLEAMLPAVDAAPGSFIEQKSACVVWHHRVASPEHALPARDALLDALRPLCEAHRLRLTEGNCTVEVRVATADKGLLVGSIAQGLPPSTFILAVGDDTTDEDMFAALPERAVTVHAGELPSCATYRVHGPRAVRELLEALCSDPT